MKLVIFGATGFIGGAVARKARAYGHDVVAVVRSQAGVAQARAAGLQPVQGDLASPSSWIDAARQADAIIQLAASFGPDGAELERVWLEAVLAVAGADGRTRRIVHTGGCWLYPARIDPPVSEADPFDPVPAFSYMVEHRSRLMAAGADAVFIHPAMVWSEAGGFFGDMVAAVRAGEPVDVVGAAHVRWPLVHVEDLARLYVAALTRGVTGADYLAAADPGVPVAHVIRRAEVEAGRPARLRRLTTEAAMAEMGGWAAGLARSQVIHAAHAGTALAWKPQTLFDPASASTRQ